MPEMAGEVTVRSLLISGGVIGVCITAFCVALTVAARHFPPSTIWIASATLVGGFGSFAFARLYLQPLVIQNLSLLYGVFFLAALLGLPSAAAVWVSIRRAARPNRRSVILDALLVTATFVVALPLAAIVAAVPDMITFFG